MRVRSFTLLCAIGLAVTPAHAGEIIGNTYISEKDGVLEITAEAWSFKDTETPGGFKLVEMTTKQALKGMAPSIMFFRLAHQGGAITPEFMLQQLRDGFAKQGMQVGPMETRRVAGKRVLALPLSLTKGEGKSNGLVYMLQGEKSLYWVQFFSNVLIWDEARRMFDELMEKVKY